MMTREADLVGSSHGGHIAGRVCEAGLRPAYPLPRKEENEAGRSRS